jgi:hypothetical protein
MACFERTLQGASDCEREWLERLREGRSATTHRFMNRSGHKEKPKREKTPRSRHQVSGSHSWTRWSCRRAWAESRPAIVRLLSIAGYAASASTDEMSVSSASSSSL